MPRHHPELNYSLTRNSSFLHLYIRVGSADTRPSLPVAQQHMIDLSPNNDLRNQSISRQATGALTTAALETRDPQQQRPRQHHPIMDTIYRRPQQQQLTITTKTTTTIY